MRMRILAPAQVAGERVEPGAVVEVEAEGEAHRLTHYGQAIPEPEPEPDHAPPPHKAGAYQPKHKNTEATEAPRNKPRKESQ